jgi:hypothetical protein
MHDSTLSPHLNDLVGIWKATIGGERKIWSSETWKVTSKSYTQMRSNQVHGCEEWTCGALKLFVFSRSIVNPAALSRSVST